MMCMCMKVSKGLNKIVAHMKDFVSCEKSQSVSECEQAYLAYSSINTKE